MGAVVVRAGSRAVWGLALPAVLSIAAYGRYQLLITVAVMAAQLALLGTPQTIVRHTGQRVPMGPLLIRRRDQTTESEPWLWPRPTRHIARAANSPRKPRCRTAAKISEPRLRLAVAQGSSISNVKRFR